MNSKEPEYTVVESGNMGRLVENVNRMLRDGWRPQGGISGLYNLSGYYYLQAMVRP